PKPNERNILITSALPYVNNVPHLGNIIGCVLSADVFARFARLRGYNTLYVCGTDEYGTATETKALEEKISCQELCDKYHKIHDEVYRWFDVDFDFFGRTTTNEQTKITQDIFKKLDKNGYILEDSMTQLYCPQHSSFLADRFVEGICPYCNKEGARGDQCDSCGHLINAVELKEPKCKLDGATPIVRNSDHLFLELGKLQEKCEGWVEKSISEGKWSSNGVTITNSWLKEGLKPRCITRDLKWGTPVPRPGYEHKVFYVWFDACIGYPSITANYTPEWEKWWKNPEHVQLFQFMGKDNVPFHTVVFPSSLIGTGEEWTMLHHISTTEYLQYEGTKFSKSKGVGVFGNNVMESGIPVEVWRYYLLSSRPETNDSQFLWAELIAANNNILLANFGNYINRVIKFLAAKYDSTVPTYKTTETPEAALITDINALLSEYVQSLESVKIRAALKVVMDISARGNQYLQDSKLDNTLFNSNRPRCDNVLGLAINLCYLLAALIYPYMPTTSESVLKQLNLPQRTISDTWTGDDVLPGHRVGFAEYLFKKIDEARVEELRARYGGKESTEANAKVGTPAPAEAPASKKKAKAAAAGSGLNEVPEGVAKTAEMAEIETKIKAQGELVRKLKTEKASAEEVKKAVDELLALKTKLGDLVAKA
ncbi:tRNA synthetases class I (M)-domain-containing protein, partial [Cladochytrium replicatum]